MTSKIQEVLREPMNSCFESSFDSELIPVIIGQRQIGKTTFAIQFIKDKIKELKLSLEEDFLHINLDKLYIREQIIEERLENFIQSYFQERISDFKKLKIIFIDEVQKLPDIFEEIKVIFDEERHNSKIKFILSGSSSLDLYKKSAESLAGRINYRRAFAFNYYESLEIQGLKSIKGANYLDIFRPEKNFEELSKDFLDDCSSFNPNLNYEQREIINFSLLYGSMPEIVKAFDASATAEQQIMEYLRDYRQTYIEKDIRSLNRVGELKSFSKLFDTICMQPANLLSKTNLSKDLGINIETVNNYLSILEDTFIIDLLEPYHKNPKKRIVKSPKLYSFDNGLLSLALGFPDLKQLKASGLIGGFFENLVLAELKKIFFNVYPYLSISFYRTYDGAEIDFILDFKRKVIPIEIKWTEKSKGLNLRTLKSFIKEDALCDYGVVVYMGKFEIDFEAKIIFLPFGYLSAI